MIQPGDTITVRLFGRDVEATVRAVVPAGEKRTPPRPSPAVPLSDVIREVAAEAEAGAQRLESADTEQSVLSLLR